MALRSLGASLLSTVLLLPPLTNAANTPTKCYVLSGLHNADAGFRCDNSTTGHSSCCQPGAICYSNGVCQQGNSGIQDYMRVGCTDPTWQDPACLDQCTSYARNSVAGIRFCGGAITSTNRYCCDNGTTGIGSFACCQNPKAIFDINPIATFVAQIPLSFTSTSTTASSTASSISSSTSAASTTASSSSTPTHDPPRRRPGSHALAIGLGVGIPLLVILVAAIAFFLWRYFHDDEENLPLQPEISEPGVMYLPVDPTPREVPSSMPNPNKAYYGGREYDPGPHELPVQGIVHELHTPNQERR